MPLDGADGPVPEPTVLALSAPGGDLVYLPSPLPLRAPSPDSYREHAVASLPEPHNP